MSDFRFGIIFKNKPMNKNKNIIAYNIDNIFFAKDGLILNGKFKGKSLGEIKEDVFPLEVNELPPVTKEFAFTTNKKLKSLDLSSEEVSDLVDICYSYSAKPLLADLSKGNIYLSNIYPVLNRELDIIVKEYFSNLINKALKECEPVKEEKEDGENVLSIINELKEIIKGQDEAIESVVTNVLINLKTAKENVNIQKNTILIDGSTGTGKTLLVTELAKILNSPVIIKNSTNYSTVGYVGDDLKSILTDLLRTANSDISKAENGIVCLDEIDKLGDTSLEIRRGIQQELLSYLSGTTVEVTLNKKNYMFDTSNLTFIFMGAFTNMKEKKNKSIGFDSKENIRETTTDYVKAGMLREFMGRINVITKTNDLKIEDIENILINSKISPLKELILIGKLYSVEITFTEGFIKKASFDALKENIGARGIHRVINKVKNKLLLPIMTGSLSEVLLTEDILEDEYELDVNKRTLKQN